MDEVDGIIVQSLQQIGCEISDDIISLTGFSPELLVETVSKCLKLIRPSLNLPQNLPQGMAQKFSVTATLAEACISIGFKGEIGYQTFLYPNVGEIRRVFMFLIERLPKETEKLPLIQPFDKLTNIENEINHNINIQLIHTWIPQYCNKFNVRKYDTNIYSLNGNSIKFQPQLNLNIPNFLNNNNNNNNDNSNNSTELNQTTTELHKYWLKRSPNLFQQTNSQTICPTVIHINDIEYYNDINDRNYNNILNLICINNNQKTYQKISFNNDNNDNKMNKKLHNINDNGNKLIKPLTLSLNNNELDNLNLHLEKLKDSIKELLIKRKSTQLEIQKANDYRIQNDKLIQQLKDIKKIKERTFILLENPNENLQKMENLIASANEKIKNLTEQWETHKVHLLEMLENLKSKNQDKFGNNDTMEQIKQVREKISNVTEEIKIKTGLHTHFINELQKINKLTSRNAYTTRILEIIGNIRKQKNDIDRVLRDTRDLQKQINNISGQLDRQFTVTDDLLYKTAKRDEYSKKAYKLLAQLHSNCCDLINLVQETGAMMREVRDLEDQIEKEKTRNITTNLEKITFDLKQMEKDSKEIQEKIQKMETQITQG